MKKNKKELSKLRISPFTVEDIKKVTYKTPIFIANEGDAGAFIGLFLHFNESTEEVYVVDALFNEDYVDNTYYDLSDCYPVPEERIQENLEFVLEDLK